jgi:hypothetical protein
MAKKNTKAAGEEAAVEIEPPNPLVEKLKNAQPGDVVAVYLIDAHQPVIDDDGNRAAPRQWVDGIPLRDLTAGDLLGQPEHIIKRITDSGLYAITE